tara:strand:- start:632 stop:1315 length:684 start_codon:yes stop_codon:yes gene_type:complete
MNRIAVCISGEMRYWEVVSHIYESWNVDFFISTWDTTNRNKNNYPYKFHGNSNINNDLLRTLNPKKYDFLSRKIEDRIKFNLPKYYYLIYRCNLLKTQYELEQNFVYDCVLVTRPDVHLDINLIDILSSKSLDELVVYSSEITYQEEFFGISTMDASAYGKSSTMDIFSNAYNHIYLSDDYNMIPMGHSFIPHYLKYVGLSMGKGEIDQNLINKIRNYDDYKGLIRD